MLLPAAACRQKHWYYPLRGCWLSSKQPAHTVASFSCLHLPSSGKQEVDWQPRYGCSGTHSNLSNGLGYGKDDLPLHAKVILRKSVIILEVSC